jgi:acyl dehydratase
MPIDLDSVAGVELPERHDSWGVDAVILYQLGLGAGASPADLPYVYERGLKVLPTYGVIPALQSILQLFALDGFDVNLGKVLHGEHELIIHAPLPTAAEVLTRAKVAGIYDKGKGALTVLETVTRNAEDGQELCTNRFSLFVVGEGGFGGAGGPAGGGGAPPDREPDQVVSVPTLPQQALIYRLSGDKNPLHADPGFAAKAGFKRPILHGLCSYGIACRAVVDAMLDGDVTRVASFRARFSGVLVPGETLRISLWREGDQVVLSGDCAERNASVLSNAVLGLRA